MHTSENKELEQAFAGKEIRQIGDFSAILIKYLMQGAMSGGFQLTEVIAARMEFCHGITPNDKEYFWPIMAEIILAAFEAGEMTQK